MKLILKILAFLSIAGMLGCNLLSQESTPTLSTITTGNYNKQAIQTTYEELGLVFEPPTIENGQTVTIGGIVLNDDSIVNVLIYEEEYKIIDASVSIWEPNSKLDNQADPEYAAKTHEKWLFVMQKMLDAVFPEWSGSSEWLDTTLRSFGDVQDRLATGETTRNNLRVILEAEIQDGVMAGYTSISLIIRPLDTP